MLASAHTYTLHSSAPTTQPPSKEYLERAKREPGGPSESEAVPGAPQGGGASEWSREAAVARLRGADAEPAQQPRSQQLVRAYTVWPTKNVFCCFGHCMTGPDEDVGPNTCAWLTMLTPMALFFYVWGAELYEAFPHLLGGVLACFAASIVSLLVTSFTDPGILPRNPDPLAHRQPQPPIYRNRVDEYGVVCTDTWCSTCLIYRPPRASHCQDCDNCVLDFDHHCPFTRNCIGARSDGSNLPRPSTGLPLAFLGLPLAFHWPSTGLPRPCTAGARNYGFFICFLVSLSLSLAALLLGCTLLGGLASGLADAALADRAPPSAAAHDDALEGKRLLNFALIVFSMLMALLL